MEVKGNLDFTKNDTFDTFNYSADIKPSADFVMPTEKNIVQKRAIESNQTYGEPPAKRPAPTIRIGSGYKWNLQALANAADAVETGGKSPVSALNELGVRVSYSVLRQGGPAHCPSFNVAVTVADMTFEGWGHSKREARASAARACLTALLAHAGRVLQPSNRQHDFTADETEKFKVSDFQCLQASMKNNSSSPPTDVPTKQETSPVTTPVPTGSSPATALFGATGAAPAHKSPINLLYENYPGLSFVCTFGDGSPLDAAQAPLQLSHSMRFKVVCLVKDQKFEGYGSSKKLAKLAAARSALAVLEEGRVESPPDTVPTGFLSQTLADHIGKLVNEKFNELMKGDLVHSKRKVLAGIVLTVNNKVDGAKVIAVTTGTKCVSGEHMSERGRALNDCHAEVAARRCLQRYLYAQLLMYATAKDPRAPIATSDIEPLPQGGYQLKPDRQLHLYVSTAPCGDGRIFSPHEQTEPEPDRHPNRLARGQLRTKIESGEGTIPVKNCSNIVQTWDGVMQGERLLTMSCSDKVARWCVVGAQGALLSRILRPVYIHSLVLGSLLHPHHMYRAICGRIEAYIASLPPPFRLHRPLLARAASTEARTPARAPSFSVCWCATTPIPEVVNATTGKLESGQPSLLCKQSMFARWQYLAKRLPLLPQELEAEANVETLPPSLEGLLYSEAKQLCPTYQVAKECLIQAFEKAKLGRWIKKPMEQDQFVCEIHDADPSVLFAWAGPALPKYSFLQSGIGDVGLGDDRNDDEHVNSNSSSNNDVSDDKNLCDDVKDAAKCDVSECSSDDSPKREKIMNFLKRVKSQQSSVMKEIMERLKCDEGDKKMDDTVKLVDSNEVKVKFNNEVNTVSNSVKKHLKKGNFNVNTKATNTKENISVINVKENIIVPNKVKSENDPKIKSQRVDEAMVDLGGLAIQGFGEKKEDDENLDHIPVRNRVLLQKIKLSKIKNNIELSKLDISKEHKVTSSKNNMLHINDLLSKMNDVKIGFKDDFTNDNINVGINMNKQNVKSKINERSKVYEYN